MEEAWTIKNFVNGLLSCLYGPQKYCLLTLVALAGGEKSKATFIHFEAHIYSTVAVTVCALRVHVLYFQENRNTADAKFH